MALGISISACDGMTITVIKMNCNPASEARDTLRPTQTLILCEYVQCVKNSFFCFYPVARATGTQSHTFPRTFDRS